MLTAVSMSCSGSTNRRNCALAGAGRSALFCFVAMSGGSAPIRPPTAASSPATRSRFTPLIRPFARKVSMPIAIGVPPLISEADFQPPTVAVMVRSSRPFWVGVRVVSAT